MVERKAAGARHHLTIAEKNQLRACHRERPDMTQELLRDWVHSKFGKWVGRSTIGKIASSPDEVCVNQDAKRNQSGRFPEMERVLFEFVCAQCVGTESGAVVGGDAATALAGGGHTVGEHSQTRPVVNDTVLWTKANEILKATMGEQVSVSIGWVQRFKKRHGLHKGQKRPLQHSVATPTNAFSTADISAAMTSSASGGIDFTPTPMEPTRVIQTVAVTSTAEVEEVPVNTAHVSEATEAALVPESQQTTSLSQQHEPASIYATLSPQQTSKPPMKQMVSRKQFVAAEDILLLEQVLATKPWAYAEPLDGWRRVADELRSHDQFNLEKSAGACQARVALLVDHARSGNEAALRKSGTAIEFQEKMRLLAEIMTACDTAKDAAGLNGKKRSASQVIDQATEPQNTRQRIAEELIDVGPATIDAGDTVPPEDDEVTRRIAQLEAKLEQELADQRRHAEQQVRELSEQYHRQLEHQQRQFDQQLASVHKQQATIIELLKIIVERSGGNQTQRPH